MTGQGVSRSVGLRLGNSTIDALDDEMGSLAAALGPELEFHVQVTPRATVRFMVRFVSTCGQTVSKSPKNPPLWGGPGGPPGGEAGAPTDWQECPCPALKKRF